MIDKVNGIDTIGGQYELMKRQVTQENDIGAKEGDPAVVLELGKSQTKSGLTYGNPKSQNVDRNEVNRLIAETEKSYQGLRDLIEKLLIRQNKKWEDVFSGKEVLEIDNETRIQAQAAISDDGEWGVKAVSDRLVAFAIAVSGNDKTKAQELRNAIEKGFKEAERIWGGQLPEISRKTFDATMEKLDNWANNGD